MVDSLLALDTALLDATELQRACHRNARMELRRARLLRLMPKARDAVLDGRLSLDHIDLILRYATTARFDLYLEHEAMLVARLAATRLIDDARKIMQYWAHAADDTLGRQRKQPDPSTLYASRDHVTGELHLTGHLDPIDGEIVETFLFDGPTTILSVSHRRTFTGKLRRAIQVRDRRCQHPSGCPTPAVDGDIDHHQPHAHGGPTSQFNAKAECSPHNRLAHLHESPDDLPGASPPERQIDRLDEIRALIRWRFQQMDNPFGDTDDDLAQTA